MKNLVKGYLTAENPAGLVRHVAEFPDGKLAITAYEHPEDSHYFNRPNWRWDIAQVIPHGARFIGHYEAEPNMHRPHLEAATNRARREAANLGDFCDWLNAIDAEHGYDCRRSWGTVDQWRALFDAGRTRAEAAEHLKWNSVPRAI